MSNLTIAVKDKTEAGQIIKVAPFKKDIRKTTPHKHNNYFEIIYLRAGKGNHYIDARKFAINGPIVFFVRKDQTHHFDLQQEADGYVAIIKQPFMEKSSDNELKLLMTKLGTQACLQLPEDDTIGQLFQLLTVEYDKYGRYSFPVIEGLLKALLAKMLGMSQPVIRSSEIASDLYQAFLAILQSGDPIRNSVQYYAEKLNTSPQNLNAVCRKATNQTSTQVLGERIISEAKRLLAYTQNTVTQVALSLDFKDPSHFVKYFKRITGQTPQAFRLSTR